ncbi:MAG: acyl-CoA desaturase [Candidatus Glassbacteria bacterium]|nr:acyl-CoA desaturase [Candidatus Glassbacteria bacterium]
MPICLFLAVHWYLSLFCQSFFLHRFGAHRMFHLPPFWKRFFYLMTFFSQGASFLNPRAYAVMHRMHHAWSDTDRDPHSPHYSPNIVAMMVKTYGIYTGLLSGKIDPGQFGYDLPEWKAVDKLSENWLVRLAFAGSYIAFYLAFAPSWWYFLLLPVHFLIGPIQGALVNWCGHKYGYVNHRETGDRSRNTLALDILLLGELFQNNHHRYPQRMNFANRWFELDPVWPLIKVLAMLRVVKVPSS